MDSSLFKSGQAWPIAANGLLLDLSRLVCVLHPCACTLRSLRAGIPSTDTDLTIALGLEYTLRAPPGKSFAAAGFNKIVGAINHTTGFSAMPQGGDKLEQCDIDFLTAWIDAGAPE